MSDFSDARDLHLARQAVERDELTFLDRFAADAELPARFVDLERAGPNDRWFPHLAADDGGVGCHAAGGREDALRDEHAVYIVGHRLATHEDHLLALLRPLDGVIGREHHLPARGAW